MIYGSSGIFFGLDNPLLSRNFFHSYIFFKKKRPYDFIVKNFFQITPEFFIESVGLFF